MKTETKLLIGLALIALALTGRAQNMVGETVPQSQTVLDSYFVSNSAPNQLQYWEFIDTMYWYIAAEYTNALAAAQSAQASQAANDRKFASLYLTFGQQTVDTPQWSFIETNGFTNETIGPFGQQSGVSYLTLTNYFTTPRTNFPPVFFTLYEPSLNGGNLAGYTSITQGFSMFSLDTGYLLNSNYFVIYLGESSSTIGTNLYWFTFYQ